MELVLQGESLSIVEYSSRPLSIWIAVSRGRD